MDFNFSKDQKLIQTSVRDFLEKECPSDKVRELAEDAQGYDPRMWRKMAELGWMGILFPDEYGGTDGDFMDLIIVLEGMGRYLCPSPFFSTVVLGGLPILYGGSEDQKKTLLPKIASGKMIVTMALTEPAAGYDASSIKVGAAHDGGGYVINGTKLFTPDAHIADCILCVVRTKESPNPEDGITLFLVDAHRPGLKCTPLKTITRDRQCEILFDQVRAAQEDMVGSVHQGWPIVKDTLGKAAVARCAEMLGGAQAVLEMSIQYAKKRVQFDRPIGSFQAVQQHFADMWMGIHITRHMVHKAAWKISRGEAVTREAAMAKSRTGEVYRLVTTLAHQIFGAIGFTMEHDMHLYHRHAIGGDITFGNSDLQKEIVARELGL
jgi:3-oxocholest-4-en-26-oyl-CoA dehydrogenase beta subunit